MNYRRNLLFALVLITVLVLTGCARRSRGRAGDPIAATQPGGQAVATVEAVCYPPMGWSAEPLKETSRSRHQIWLSPSGCTAYGVIHFSLPWPVGPDMVLRGFLREMQRQEGTATLLGKQQDPDLPGLRFEAKGNVYHLWGNLIVRGWEGWAIYAGGRANEPLVPWEMDLAKAARESTRVGIDD